jgi:hypothetical protein
MARTDSNGCHGGVFVVSELDQSAFPDTELLKFFDKHGELLVILLERVELAHAFVLCRLQASDESSHSSATGKRYRFVFRSTLSSSANAILAIVL